MTMTLNPHSAPKMSRAPRYRHKVASIRKNSLERIDIELIEYNGNDLCHIAVKRDSSGHHSLNRMKETARYVSLNVRLLPQLITALQDAQRKAFELGIVDTSNQEATI
ncbi:MAG TPA: hypothetical protein VIH18_20340 [Candidatus Binatia bacterium]|jgi:hypothetical protein